jgi:hypothetical protein
MAVRLCTACAWCCLCRATAFVGRIVGCENCEFPSRRGEARSSHETTGRKRRLTMRACQVRKCLVLALATGEPRCEAFIMLSAEA